MNNWECIVKVSNIYGGSEGSNTTAFHKTQQYFVVFSAMLLCFVKKCCVLWKVVVFSNMLCFVKCVL